jgi:hypothetical protein
MNPRAVALVAAALLTIAAPSQAAPSCREGFTCPGRAGRVEVTLAGFDGSAASTAAGVLDSDEIQCALDCLDGDADSDHVLAGPGAPRTPTPVRGGVVLFDAGVTYRIQRSLLLPAATDNALILDGQGARLTIRRESPEPIAVLQRVAPAGANNCDVEAMTSWAFAWTIQNLAIAGDGFEGDTGIALHGTNSLTIRSCWLASLGTGVDLRFAIAPAIDQCVFLNNRRHDAHLGDGAGECGPGGAGACFGPCATGAATFPKATTTRQLVEGGCNGAVIRHCRFLMHPQQLSSIRLRNSRAVVVDGPMFDGYRGRHAIHHSDFQANDLSVRDMYFETNIERPEAVIRFDGGSRLLVEGLHVVAGVPVVAVDADGNQGATIVVRVVSWMPKTIRFRNGSNAWRNEWRFQDVAADDLASAARWVDGPPPRALVSDRVSSSEGQQSSAGQVLRVPVGAPERHGLKLKEGQVWFDPQSRRLMVCCDAQGRPKDAGR